MVLVEEYMYLDHRCFHLRLGWKSSPMQPCLGHVLHKQETAVEEKRNARPYTSCTKKDVSPTQEKI